MRETTLKQMEWFVRTLLKTRLDPELTDGYDASIHFKLAWFNKALFRPMEVPVKDYIDQMLGRIQNDTDFLRENGMIGYKLLCEEEGNGDLEIIGCTTGLLKAYLKRLRKSANVFGKAKDELQRQILTVMGEKTKVLISGDQDKIFSYLLKHFDEDVSYEELFSEIRRGSLRGEDFWSAISGPQRKMSSVNVIVNNLRATLKKAGRAYGVTGKEVVSGKRGGTYRMVL